MDSLWSKIYQISGRISPVAGGIHLPEWYTFSPTTQPGTSFIILASSSRYFFHSFTNLKKKNKNNCRWVNKNKKAIIKLCAVGYMDHILFGQDRYSHSHLSICFFIVSSINCFGQFNQTADTSHLLQLEALAE